MEGYVKTEAKNGVAIITFHHPLSNSLPSSLLGQLVDAIHHADKNDSAKIILIKSSGEGIFCAGGSFDEMLAIKDAEKGKSFFMGFANVINAIRKAQKFVLVRVQGKVVGGGVGIVSAADYAFATKDASIKLSELAIGIGPFVIGPVVTRKIGVSAFSSLTINATNWKTAQWASEKGLYNDVAESAEAMDNGIEILCNQLVNSNPEAMKMLKNNLWAGTEHWDTLLSEQASVVSKLVISDYAVDALSKFKKK